MGTRSVSSVTQLSILAMALIMTFSAVSIDAASTSSSEKSFTYSVTENPFHFTKSSGVYLPDADGNTLISYHLFTYEESQFIKELAHSHAAESENYQKMNGLGTGLSFPSDEELELLVNRLRVVDDIETFSQDQSLKSPSSVDLSEEPYFPQVRSQGGQGSCAAWAITYYAYGYLEARDNGWTDASTGNESHLMSPAWTYNMVNGGYDSGSSMYSNARIIIEWGVSTWEKMPYKSTDAASWGGPEAWREAPLHRGLDVYTITFNGDSTVNQVKELVTSGIPVTFAIDASQYTSGFADKNYVISSVEYDSSTVNHAQTIVGYDDTISDDGETGAFKVVNSWGSSWGDGGFYWLTYDAFKEIGNLLFLTFITDRPSYQPELLATWHFNAPPSRESSIEVGIGSTSSPVMSRTPYFAKNAQSYDHRFPTFMCMDITEFFDSWKGGNHLFYLRIGNTDVAGEVSSFRIEVYDTSYHPGKCSRISVQSSDVPASTPCTVTNSLDDYEQVSLLDGLDFGGGNASTEGTAGWVGVRSASHDGSDSVQSGDIGDSGQSVLTLVLEGPALYRFYWKVSSEPDHDVLKLVVDGEERENISGEVDWTAYSFSLPAGEHQVQFIYEKDGSNSQFEDCAWVDDLRQVPVTIWIDGDEQFRSVAALLGIPGNGSADNPYVLEGLSIDVQSKGAAVYIGNTTAHFVIRHCYLSNASDSGSMFAPGAAVSLFNVSNGTVHENSLTGSKHGLSLYGCRNVVIVRNNISGNSGSGLIAVSSQDCAITDNLFGWNTGYGLELRSSSGCTITENIFNHNNGAGSGHDSSIAQAYDDTVNNSWDDGEIGNYWSDFNGSDSNADFIIDTPYSVGENFDLFPLLHYIAPPWNLTVSYLGNMIELRWDLPNYSAYWEIVRQKVYSRSSEVVLEAEVDASITTLTLPLPSSDTEFYVRAIVSSGEEGPASSSVTVKATDTEPPEVGIISPLEGAFAGTNVTVAWTASDNGEIDHFELRVDYGTWVEVGTVQEYTLVFLSEGPHTVEVMAVDVAGNCGNDSVTFTVDTTPPALQITSPVSGAVINSTSITVVWSCSDAVSGIRNSSIRLDGGEWIPKGTSSQHLFSGLSEGQHSVEVMVLDRAGHSTVENVVFYIDTTPPAVNITFPDNGPICYLNTTEVLIRWTGVDDGSGIKEYVVTLDDGPPVVVGSEVSYLVDLAPGKHSVTVSAVDNAGNAGSDVIEVVIDLVPPAVNILSPMDGQLLEDRSVTVMWNGTDEYGIRSYWTRLDAGVWILKNGTNLHTYDNLTDGDHVVYVMAEDLAGNTVTVQREFSVWGFPLQLEVISPSDGEIINRSDPVVEWEVSGAFKGIDHCEIRLDDGFWQNVGAVGKTVLESIPDGLHLIHVRVYDNGGRMSEASVGFMVDTEAPVLTILSPLPGQIINDSYLTVSWSGYDEGSGISGYALRLDEGQWRWVGARSGDTLTSLSSGSHIVYVRAYDNAGNANTISVNFKIAPMEMKVEIITPLNGSILASSDVTIQWSGSDSGTGIDYYMLKVDNGSWLNVGLSNQYNLTLPDGEHAIRVMMVDGTGLNVTASVYITVDTTPPSVEITSPTAGEIFSRSEIEVVWRGEDEVSGVSCYWISLDGAIQVNVGSLTSWVLTDLDGGRHRVEVCAYDVAGNSRNISVEFIIDLVPPALEVTSPDDGLLTNETSLPVSWTVADEWGIEAVHIVLDNTTSYDFDSAGSMVLTGLTHGQHMLLFIAMDLAGNSKEVTVTFTVDLEPPLLEILEPCDGQFLNTSHFIVEWHSPSTDIWKYYFCVDDGPWEEAGSNNTYWVLDLEDGTYRLKIRCVDLAGNWGQASVTVVIDTTPPSVVIYSPEEGAIYSGEELVLRWAANDSLSGISYFMIKLDDANWFTVEAEGTSVLTSLNEGEHSMTLIACDVAGNCMVVEVDFSVDLTGPEITILSPANGTLVNSSSVEFRWEGWDGVSGVSRYQLELDNGSTVDVGKGVSYVLLLPEGKNTIILRAWDGAGHSSAVSFTVFVDTTPPQIIEFWPSGEISNTEVAVRVVLGGEDIGGGLIWVEGKASESVLDGNYLTLELTDLTPSTSYTVHVKAWDAAGNTITFSWNFSTAQLSLLNGTVLDENHQPVADALVILDGNVSTVTDSSGRFSLMAAPGSHTLTIKKQGYRTETLVVEVYNEVISVTGEIEKEKHDMFNQDLLIALIAGILFIPMLQLAARSRKKR